MSRTPRLTRMLTILIGVSIIACGQITLPIAVTPAIAPTEILLYTETLVPTQTLTPSRTPTPLIISTSTPTSTPEIIDIGVPSVFIQLVENYPQDSNLAVTLLAGGKPIADVMFDLSPAVKNIVGEWAIEPYTTILYPETNTNGTFSASLEPGQYALQLYDEERVQGMWGVLFDSQDSPLIPFTIKPNFTTEIEINLAVLEIGVIRAGVVNQGERVWVYLQGNDIAGNKIPLELPYIFEGRTDATGVATFNLGAGTYIVEIDNFLGNAPVDSFFYYDITLQPGEVRREIFEIP